MRAVRSAPSPRAAFAALVARFCCALRLVRDWAAGMQRRRGDHRTRDSAETTGREGEAAVARALRARGDTVHGSRVRLRCAELDLVTLDRSGVLWIHEVKSTRQGSVPLPKGGRSPGSPPRTVFVDLGGLEARASWKQRRRLERARRELVARTRLRVGIRLHSAVLCDDGNCFLKETVLRRP